MNYINRTWAEIDLDAALYNLNAIKAVAGSRKIMCVIKAEAYGHGADSLALFYQENGIEAFAVATIDEALKLRKIGITKDILVLGYTPAWFAKALAENNIIQTVHDFDYAAKLSDELLSTNFTLKIHVKIDTGMSRLGFTCKDENGIKNTCDAVLKISSLPCLKINGIFTHFACSDSNEEDDINFTKSQYDNYLKAYKLLNETIDFEYYHCCNSAATFNSDLSFGNVVRTGIILYGINPSFDFKTGFIPKPVLSLKSTVSEIKTIHSGEFVSYGKTFEAKKDMKIAVVTVGYGDGYPRALSNKGKVIINDKFASIIGRVCMDQLMVDISDIDNVEIGTEVILIGKSKELEITADDIAKISDTIPYETLCNISARVPRVYFKDGNIVSIKYFLA